MPRRCPTCARPLPAADAVGAFCSERCRLIDLGAWLTEGERAIPGGRAGADDPAAIPDAGDEPPR